MSSQYVPSWNPCSVTLSECQNGNKTRFQDFSIYNKRGKLSLHLNKAMRYSEGKRTYSAYDLDRTSCSIWHSQASCRTSAYITGYLTYYKFKKMEDESPTIDGGIKNENEARSDEAKEKTAQSRRK